MPTNRENETYFYLPKITFDPWQKCLSWLAQSDDARCRDWKEDIDTFLVFTGLFAAIVTAFTVESYKWLQPDPLDINNKLLLILVTNGNTSSAENLFSPNQFTPDAASIRINCLWFSSITLSLISALMGVVCKQWIRGFQCDAAVPPKEAIALRQMRFRGLEYWQIPNIIHALPIILQVAVYLFFAGLLDLLWSRLDNAAIAAPITVLIGIAALFTAFTTVMPAIDFFLIRRRPRWEPDAFSPPCAYKCPQSWLILKIIGSVASIVTALTARLCASYNRTGKDLTPSLSTWLEIERNRLRLQTWEDVSLCVHYHSMGLQRVFNDLHLEKDVARAVVYSVQNMINEEPYFSHPGRLSKAKGLFDVSSDMLLRKLQFYRSGSDDDSECRLELSLRTGTPSLLDLLSCNSVHDRLLDDLWSTIHAYTDIHGLSGSIAAVILVAAFKHQIKDVEPQRATVKLRDWLNSGRIFEWRIDRWCFESMCNAFGDSKPPTNRQAFIDLYKALFKHYHLTQRTYSPSDDYAPELIPVVARRLDLDPNSLMA